MKKFFALFSLLLLASPLLHATAPVRYVKTYKQSDGTEIKISINANGRFTTYTTADGLALVRNASGDFCYATQQAGDLVSTEIIAHETNLRSQSETAKLSSLHPLKLTEANTLLETLNPRPTLHRTSRVAASTSDGLGTYGQTGGGVLSSIGSPTIPVVMIDFADKTFQDTITTEKVTRFFNEEGYQDETGSKGSVRDYFADQSQGLFTPSCEVVAHVTLSKGYAYYGADSSNGSTDPNFYTFVSDALKAVNEAGATFSPYATDGEVPLVILMFAGPGQQSSFETGHSDFLWAKFSSSRTYTVDNGATKVRSYIAANELLQQYGTTREDIRGAALDGIGLVSHEMGHSLGLPDFYVVNGTQEVKDTLKTMDYWDIMDYGQYYRNGYRPVGYTAYERSAMGWLKVTELTEAQRCELFPFGREADGSTAYVIRNANNENEYYLLENRQPGKWYPTALGSGLFVLHVDYSATSWNASTVNDDPNHQRMTYVPADNHKDGVSTASITLSQLLDGYKGDLYPGTQNVTSLTDETIPAMTAYQGTTGYMGKPIYGITATADSTITFAFLDETLTGISRPVSSAEAASTAAYTLSGCKVNSLRGAAPGIYIRGSRKVIIR